MISIIHATHEALFKMGGIGAVLEGLITSNAYKESIGRTFLAGPVPVWNPEERLEEESGEVLYSRVTHVDRGGYAKLFSPIEERHGTRIIYGRRKLRDRIRGTSAHPEIVLVDPMQINLRHLDEFKYFLAQRFGFHPALFQHIEDFERYIKIAGPAFEACKALLGDDPGPYHVIAHEYMGIPMALRAILEGDPRFRSVFHAHETATVRPLVEENIGHDTRFYNVLQHAFDHGLFLEDCFGSQDDFFKHALLKQSHHCDRIFAVGDFVQQEFQFLSPVFQSRPIHLVYNGIPSINISLEERRTCKRKLVRYAQNLLGYKPDLIFAHVSRMVRSKGIWRDLRVLEHLDELLRYDKKTAVLFLLSSLAEDGRSVEDIERMEADYGWPIHHEAGWPDLEGEEISSYTAIQAFNAHASHIRVVYLNQVGWSRHRCGKRMPSNMEFSDLRKGQDVEFGQSIYEPFGIAQLEALTFGAICVPSNICGCVGFVDRATESQGAKNVIVADYISLPGRQRSLSELLDIGYNQRNEIEFTHSMKVASMMYAFLPRTQRDEIAMLQEGYSMASRMSWEVVARDHFLPGLPD